MSRKSFCRSGSQTLFFGGREATTVNASAVSRLVGVGLKNNLYLFVDSLGPQTQHSRYYSYAGKKNQCQVYNTQQVFSAGDVRRI